MDGSSVQALSIGTIYMVLKNVYMCT